jgi:predicted RNase H-like HicB family nuclease
MAVKIPNSMLFRACVYPSEDIQGYFVAHCLELDVIGEGATPQDAIIELTKAIDIQLESCTTLSQFFFPAPDEIWQRYEQNSGRVILQKIVEQAVHAAPPADFLPRFEKVVATSSVPEVYVKA